MNETIRKLFFPELRWFVPTKWADVVRRSGIRVGFCALPYLLIACWYAVAFHDDRLLRFWEFWWCVVIIPAAGFLTDVWRIQETERRNNPTA